MTKDARAGRLKRAREAHYETATAAAIAIGVPVGTYAGHENGHRDFGADAAELYARRFRVSPAWLMFGIEPGSPALDEVERELLLKVSQMDPRRKAALAAFLEQLFPDPGSGEPQEERRHDAPGRPPRRGEGRP